MKLLMESCYSCEAVFGCGYNDFSRCSKIEMATAGLGVPYKPKDTSYLENIPFGVYMGLKHIVEGSGING